MRCIAFVLLAGCAAAAAPDKPALVLQSHPTASEYGESEWMLSGGARDEYIVRRDGDGWLLEPHASTYGKYGTWMRNIDATPYRNKRVRITIEARTHGAAQRVDVWSRAQAPEAPADGPGLGGDLKSLPAESSWSSYAMVFDVPASSVHLQYGVGIAGPGALWMRGAKLEVVDASVAVTSRSGSANAEAWAGETTVGEWTLTGIGAPDYTATMDGAAVRVDTKTTSERYVALVHVVPAAEYVGKTVHATFEAKVDNFEQGACVMKVQRERKLTYAGFLAADLKELSGTHEFAPCSLSTPVGADAKWILFGVTHRGAGKAWVRDPKLEAK
jgi:hypothetical protein